MSAAVIDPDSRSRPTMARRVRPSCADPTTGDITPLESGWIFITPV